MPTSRKTSAHVAKHASKVLRTSRSHAAKAAAVSALSQRAPKKRR